MRSTRPSRNFAIPKDIQQPEVFIDEAIYVRVNLLDWVDGCFYRCRAQPEYSKGSGVSGYSDASAAIANSRRVRVESKASNTIARVQAPIGTSVRTT